MNDQLTTYIRQGLAVGAPPDAIRRNLLSVGWNQMMVDQAIRDLTAPTKHLNFRRGTLLIQIKKKALGEKIALAALAVIPVGLLTYFAITFISNRPRSVTLEQTNSHQLCLDVGEIPAEICDGLNLLTQGRGKVAPYTSESFQRQADDFFAAFPPGSQILIDAESWYRQSSSLASVTVEVRSKNKPARRVQLFVTRENESWKLDTVYEITDLAEQS